nr:MAG TPA: hypothetical protein [Caudoviricetes sp.]
MLYKKIKGGRSCELRPPFLSVNFKVLSVKLCFFP